MPAITEIKEEVNDLIVFKHISAAFTEASAVKLNNLRKKSRRNAQFYDEITHIYHLVEVNAKRLKMEQIEEQKTTAPTALSVALTSNMRFFGNLNLEIMKLFLTRCEKDKSERLVIGKTGLDFLRSIVFKQNYEKLIFQKDLPSDEETQNFLNRIRSYDRVLIYYPKFISFLKQTVEVTDITQKLKAKEETEEDISLIFEPELTKMVKFFENQVRLLLFQRVILETEVARTAARLLSMSQAEEHADREIKSKKTELRKVIRSILNARLLDTFTGIKKWKHK